MSDKAENAASIGHWCAMPEHTAAFEALRKRLAEEGLLPTPPMAGVQQVLREHYEAENPGE